MAESAPSADDVPVVPVYSAGGAEEEVDFKLDNDATAFSEQNAYFLARVSSLCYQPKDEVRGVLETLSFWGKGAAAGDNFQWFEANDEVVDESPFDALHDTEAFVAVNEGAIVVVFRGSSGGRDWLTNFSLLPRDVPKDWKLETTDGDLHRGFDDGVNTVWNPGPGHPEGMLAVIKRFYNEEGKSRKLYVTGHSLGGALATIAAARLVFVEDLNVAALYTIGAPRVFDSDVADIFDSKTNHGTRMKDKYFRCRNNNDIVARIPPSPYKHVGTEVYFDRFGAISTTSLVDRLLGRWSALLRFSFIDGVNDHSHQEYARLFKQAVISSRLSLLDKTRSVVVDAVQKVIPVNQEEAKVMQEEVEAAKEAALEASTSEQEFVPDDVPEHLVQLED